MFFFFLIFVILAHEIDESIFLGISIIDCSSFEIVNSNHPPVSGLLCVTAEENISLALLDILFAEIHSDTDHERWPRISSLLRLDYCINERQLNSSQRFIVGELNIVVVIPL